MAVLKDKKSLTALLDGVLKLSWTPKTGLLMSKTTAIVNYVAHEPIQGEQRHFSQLYTAAGAYSLPPVNKAIAVFHSPSREKRLVVREKEDNKAQVTLELWDRSRLYAAKDMKNVHQHFLNTAVLGTVAWSQSEDLVAYIAERKEVKTASFWSEDASDGLGDQFLYKETLGERHEEACNPGLFVLNTNTAEVREVPVPAEVFPAQPCFHPSNPELVYIGFTLEAYKRGISAMTNRDSRIYLHNLETSQTDSLESTLPSCLYPVFSPLGSQLAYFAFKKSLAHTSCGLLRLIDWSTKQSKTVIEEIRQPQEHFSGIYGYHETLMNLAWLSETKLIFQSVNKCNSGIYTTDLEGNVTEVDFGLERPWSAEIFSVFQGCALLKCSNFKTFPRVFAIDFTSDSHLRLLDSHALPESPTALQLQALSVLQTTKITPILHRNSPCQSTLYWTESSGPLALMIHGGPHGNGTADYTVEGTMLATLGFNLLVVNYRGSTGLGQDMLEALVGNIGRMDLEDVRDAIESAKEFVSTDRIVSIGGSHGGFLSAHMAATGLVKAAVVKNGVTNVASMNLVTDITDWPSAEAIGTATPYPPTTDDLRRMYEASPLSQAGNVSIPMLIIAGGSDKRVPCSQSIELYRVLKARGQDVKMLWYPKDGHALQTPATGYDFVLNELIWLVTKLGLS